jgi:hypothetical protein
MNGTFTFSSAAVGNIEIAFEFDVNIKEPERNT